MDQIREESDHSSTENQQESYEAEEIPQSTFGVFCYLMQNRVFMSMAMSTALIYFISTNI